MTTSDTPGKEQKSLCQPFRTDLGYPSWELCLLHKQGSGLLIGFSQVHLPSQEKGAQIKTVGPFHSPLFPCRPLLPRKRLREDLKWLLQGEPKGRERLPLAWLLSSASSPITYSQIFLPTPSSSRLFLHTVLSSPPTSLFHSSDSCDHFSDTSNTTITTNTEDKEQKSLSPLGG